VAGRDKALGPMLTIWGRANSINVQKVLWCCRELELPFTRIDAGGPHGRTGSPEYRGMNPTGLVPTLIDGDYVLWESNVIVRYLATKYGGEAIFPRALEARFNVERWMDWHATALWPAIRPVFIAAVRTPADQQDPAAMASSVEQAGRSLELLEARLAEAPFIAGESFTIADIPPAIALHRWLLLDVPKRPLPNAERWYGRMRQRPGFREHVDHPLS
jgi:glutathione S-transferase